MVHLNRWSVDDLTHHSVDMRQFIDFRQSTLPNGMRIVEAYNGSGLTFTILPDRGLDIWTAHYNGVPLTWISNGSPFPPDYGLSWSQQFNGGLLTTCGLAHVGGAETDDETGQFRDAHGLYSRHRVQDVCVQRNSVESIDLTSTISEQRLFREQMELTRQYTINLREPTIYLTDVVTNLGDQPSPLMILYHINVGFPLVSEGARLLTADVAAYPRDAAAEPGFDRWPEYDRGAARYAEQVFYHHPYTGDSGMSEVALVQADFGLSVAWNAASMPYFNQWKNTRQGIYVSGLEPANCLPEGQNAARRNGRLQWLQPGESQAFHCRMTVLDGADAVDSARQRIKDLEKTGRPARGVDLDEFAARSS